MLDPNRAFAFIALPKGHSAAEVVTTSEGEHCTVVSLSFDIATKVRFLLTGTRLSKRARVEDVDKAIALLTKFRDELAPKANPTE